MRLLLPNKLAPRGPGKLETKRMATTTAHVFGPVSSNIVGLHEMPKCYAGKRVTNYSHIPLRLNERVSTTTCVFGSCLSSGHNMNAMAEQSASIANSFPESAPASISVAENVEEQWVPAPVADILVVGMAPGNTDVVMPAQEARERMRNTGDGVAPIKNRITTANARRRSISGDARVVDAMTKEHTSR